MPPKPFPSVSKILLGSVIVILLLGLIAEVIHYNNRSTSETTTTTTAATLEPVKFYTSGKTNMSFSYPEKWQLDASNTPIGAIVDVAMVGENNKNPFSPGLQINAYASLTSFFQQNPTLTNKTATTLSEYIADWTSIDTIKPATLSIDGKNVQGYLDETGENNNSLNAVVVGKSYTYQIVVIVPKTSTSTTSSEQRVLDSLLLP